MFWTFTGFLNSTGTWRCRTSCRRGARRCPSKRCRCSASSSRPSPRRSSRRAPPSETSNPSTRSSRRPSRRSSTSPTTSKVRPAAAGSRFMSTQGFRFCVDVAFQFLSRRHGPRGLTNFLSPFQRTTQRSRNTFGRSTRGSWRSLRRRVN